MENHPTAGPALLRPRNFQWLFSSETITKVETVASSIEKQEVEWIPFSDIENEIIEDAWNFDKTGKVQLDGNYIVDLENNIVQHRHGDESKQYTLKRLQLTDHRRRAPNLQRQRFTLIDEDDDAIFLRKVEDEENEDYETYPRLPYTDNSNLQYTYFQYELKNTERTFADVVEQAAAGILKEGINVLKIREAEWLASQLRTVKHFGDRRKVDGYSTESYKSVSAETWIFSWSPTTGGEALDDPVSVEERVENWRKTKYPDEIGTTVVFLYSRDSFWYKLVNTALRNSVNATQEQIKTIGPFCWLLHEYLQRIQTAPPLTVYRGVTLTDEQRSEFMPPQTDETRRRLELLSFTSTTANRALAEIYGNTLFIIDLKEFDYGSDMGSSQYPCGANISSLSNFPEEEEFLMWPPINFRSLKYEYDSQNEKHIIYFEREYPM